MPMGIGLPELMIVLVIALIVVGPKQLPQAGRSLGSAVRQLKHALSGEDDRAPEAERLPV